MHHRAFSILCAVAACGSLLFCKARRAGLFLALVLLAIPVVHAGVQPVCGTDCNPDTPPNSTPPSGAVPADRGMSFNQRGLGTVFSAATPTGGATTVQGSSSYTYKVPMHSLPGRAGLDLNLTLYYNSHIWIPDAQGGMLMGFDRDTPGPGFQLNFGFLEWNPSPNGPSGILTTADGAKHTLSVDLNNLVPKPGPPPNNLWYECANLVCLYNSDDSSYIQVSRPLGTFDGSVCQGPNNCPAKDVTVIYKNGTQALYRSFAVVTNDIFDEFVMRPYYIRDSNGNSISINYLNDSDLSISSINDSLGRTLNFFYTSIQVQMVPGQVFQTVSLLNCVTDGASCNAPGSRNYTFSWDQSHTVNFNFTQPGQMLLGGTLFNVHSGFTTPVLTTVCRPDATCVQFNYGDWGIVNDIQELSSSGTVRYELNYDFPTAAAGALSLNPTYTHQKEIINGQTNTWTYAANTDANGLLTSSSIMDPDGLVATTTYSRKSDWADGLPIQQQMESGPICLPPCVPPTTPPLLTRNTVWTSDLAMAQSGITNGGYPTGKNPRPASITTILDDNSQSQVTMQYDNSAVPVAAGPPQGFTGSGSVTDKIETDVGATAPGPALRETVTTYTSLGNHILGLPTDIKIKDGTGKVFSHTVLAYDGSGVQSVSPLPGTGHDNNVYPSTSTIPRGNLTSSTTYADPVGDTGGVTTTFTYDMLGNRISEQAGCCTQTAWNYSSTTQYAYPDSVVAGPSGNQLATSYTYFLNTGAVATSTDWNGQVAYFNYDPSGRLSSSKGPDGVTVTTNYDDSSANPSVSQSSSANSMVTVHTTDFRGRALSDQVLNSTTLVSTVTHINDAKGRPLQVSNPYAPGETPLYTSYAYDLLGRTTQTTPPALTSGVAQNPYTTSITGLTTLFTDPAGRQHKEIRDGLNRVVQMIEPGPTGGAAGSGSVTISGSEQTASTPTGSGATPGTGNLTIGGTENSTQVQTHAATFATGSVTIAGSEQSLTTTTRNCMVWNENGDCVDWEFDTSTLYDAGSVSIIINGTPYSAPFGQGDTTSSVALNLANAINGGSLATAAASGATINIKSRNAAASANYPLSVTYSWDSSDFPYSSSFTAAPSGASLTGGTDNAYRTEYNKGNATVTLTTTVNGVSTSSSKVYAYGQNDTATTVASGLVALIHGDTNFPADATASGTVINLTTRKTGNGTGYPLVTSAITTDQYFSASAFTTTASGANLVSGQNGVVPDSGTVTVTIKTSSSAAFSKSVNYGVGSTSATLANSLVLALNGDSKSPVNASASTGSSLITLTAKTLGVATNFAVTGASVTSQGTYFTQPSFTAAAASLTGGADPSFSLTTPLVSTYSYDPFDHTLQVSNGQQIQTYVYDGLGRMTSSATPETAGQAVQYTYTDFGALAQQTDPRLVPGTSTPITTTFNYDSLNRVKTITYNDNVTPNVSYTYNAPNSANNTGGRLASVSNSVETKAYQYDVMGRIAQCLETIGGSQYAVNYAYGADGQLSSITYPSQLKISYGYDPIGRLKQLGIPNQNILSINPSDYNAAGMPLTVTYGNNIKGTFGYNNQLQTSSIQYGGATPLLSLTYLYGGSTDNGQIRGITDNVDATRSTSYQYNLLGQLQMAQTVNQTAPNSWQLAFTYDIYGNRLAETPTGGAGVMPSNYVLVDPATNHIQGSGALYDADGNMVSDSVNNYVFDAESRLASASAMPGLGVGGGSSTFGYGPDSKLVNKNGTYYIYANGQPIAEYANGAAAASPSVEYVNLGGQQIARIASGAVTFNYPDHLSIRVTADAAGNPVRTYGHFPYGETAYETGAASDFKFTSYRRDQNSGLDYADARFYSSRLGRFISMDPLLGDNRYAYVSNDPINLVDPTGMEGECTTNPFDPRPLPLCGPGGGGGGGGSASCGINFDDGGFTVTFTSGCSSFSVDFSGGSTGPFGNIQGTLHDLLALLVPIDTCPAGTFECPENGAPLFGEPSCDPRWCVMDATQNQTVSDCWNDFHKTTAGKAIEFGSVMSVIPGVNDNWKHNLGIEWISLPLLKAATLMSLKKASSSAGSQEFWSVVRGTVTKIPGPTEAGVGVAENVVKRYALPAIALATAADLFALANCGDKVHPREHYPVH